MTARVNTKCHHNQSYMHESHLAFIMKIVPARIKKGMNRMCFG